MKSTQRDKIIEGMAADKAKVWWYPPDFMQSDANFVGYEASARMSELQKEYPEMVETRRAEAPRDAKYKERRIKWEEMNNWWGRVPQSVRDIFIRHGHGLS